MAQAKQAKSNGRAKSSVKKYFNYIGGEWVKSSSGEWFDNVNPADTTDIVGRFPKSNADDVNRAVAAAKEAANRWRLTPAPKRAELLFTLGEILRENKDRYTNEMTREMGKIVKEAGGDVQEAIDCTYYTAGEGRRLHGFTTPAEMKNKFAMCVRQPVGICGLITPFNFPMAIPSWKLIPALVCGNTVVIKSGEDVPLSALNLVKACEEAGIPKGVVNLVNGDGGEIGPVLVGHEDVRLISFTGSTDTGRVIAEQCARDNKIVSLEMGGKNAIIIMDDADIDNAVEGSVWGAFGTSGQRCTASSRLVVHKKVYKKFVQKFVERVETLRVGNGLDPKTDVGPVIHEDAMERILGYIHIGEKVDGAKLATGGNRLTEGEFAKGHWFEPTVLTATDNRMGIMQDEVFGPVIPLMTVTDFDEGLRLANESRYGLSAYVFTKDMRRLMRLVRELKFGEIYVNRPGGDAVHAHHAGLRHSGIGGEDGKYGLDAYFQKKTIYVNYA